MVEFVLITKEEDLEVLLEEIPDKQQLKMVRIMNLSDICAGRRRISQLAASLKLNTRHVEAAQRFFLLAIQHNFIQGRRTQNVVAACLYTVCRREKTPRM